MKKILLFTCCLLLAACGFQLRGTAVLPFDTLYISFPQGHPIGPRLVDNPKKAQAILEILGVSNDKQILSVSGGGRVREFELRYRVSFRLVDAKREELIPTTELVLRRIIPFTDEQVVAKEGEEAMLVREMQGDSADQIVRRLEAVKVAELNKNKSPQVNP